MRYNSSIRAKRALRHNSGKSFSLFTPFIILICIGLISVLGYKLYGSLVDGEPKKGVKFELLSGTAELKAWGTDHFIDVPSGSFLMEGDEIVSSEDALMILEFPEGTILRANGGVDMVVEEMFFEKDPYRIKLMLVHGDVWINKMIRPMGKTDMQVSMGNVVVKSSDLSVLALENKIDEIVRVTSGASINVDVLNEAKNRVVETVVVAVGQEAVFSKEILSKYWNFEMPTIIEILSDSFRNSEWFRFNINADKGLIEPLDLILEDDGVSAEGGDDFEKVEENGSSVVSNNQESTNLSQNNVVLTAPSIKTVAGGTNTDENGFYVVTNHLATLIGNVSNASEVYVNDYKLQQFKANDSTWTYYANAKYNLMKEGENIYNVYYKDSSGRKSETLVVKVLYKPVASVSTPPVVTPQVNEETVEAVEEIVEEPIQEQSPPENLDDNKMPDWLL